MRYLFLIPLIQVAIVAATTLTPPILYRNTTSHGLEKRASCGDGTSCLLGVCCGDGCSMNCCAMDNGGLGCSVAERCQFKGNVFVGCCGNWIGGCTGEATRVTVHTPYSTVTFGTTTTTTREYTPTSKSSTTRSTETESESQRISSAYTRTSTTTRTSSSSSSSSNSSPTSRPTPTQTQTNTIPPGNIGGNSNNGDVNGFSQPNGAVKPGAGVGVGVGLGVCAGLIALI